jgi:hypothetical protein
VCLSGVCRGGRRSLPHSPAVSKSKRAPRRQSQPFLGRLCERISGRPIICIATLNTTSLYISDGLQATAAATAMSIMPIRSFGDIYSSGFRFSDCTVSPISSHLKQEGNTEQQPEDTHCLLLISLAALYFVFRGYFTLHSPSGTLFDIALWCTGALPQAKANKCTSPFNNELRSKCPMTMATQPKGCPPT